jgi:DNA-binding winged helix-turn-helix (wHTH) protein
LQLNIAYIKAPLKVSVESGKDHFKVEGRVSTFASQAIADIFVRLVHCSPDILKHSEIASILESNHRGITGDPNQEQETARRAIHSLRKSLQDAGVYSTIILTVRGSGYRLSNDWKVLNDHKQKSNERVLIELIELVEECKNLCDDLDVITDGSGLMYIKLDSNNASELFGRIYCIMRQILEEESRPGKNSTLFALKKELWTLASYVTFWRMGERMTEHYWRADYRAEIDTCLQAIEMYIERARV